ncbi:MAG: thioredoxin domain-containing protein [Candidatus Omnitrophota bacterium]
MRQWSCRKSKTYAALTLLTLCLISVPAGKSVREYFRLNPLVKAPYQHRSYGVASAKLWIVGFFGFPCKECATGERVIRDLFKRYPDKIYYQMRYGYLNTADARSVEACVLAECAASQGKFGPVYDGLVETQSAWSSQANYHQIFSGIVARARLDETALRACKLNNKAAQTVLAEVAQAKMLDIASVPFFIVDGKRVDSVDKLTAAVDNYFKGRAS